MKAIESGLTAPPTLEILGNAFQQAKVSGISGTGEKRIFAINHPLSGYLRSFLYVSHIEKHLEKGTIFV